MTLDDRIVTWLAARENKKYDNYNISQAMKVTPAENGQAIERLIFQGRVQRVSDGRRFLYRIPVHQEVGELAERRVFMQKPYKPGPEWSMVRERIADFRSIASKHT